MSFFLNKQSIFEYEIFYLELAMNIISLSDNAPTYYHKSKYTMHVYLFFRVLLYLGYFVDNGDLRLVLRDERNVGFIGLSDIEDFIA